MIRSRFAALCLTLFTFAAAPVAEARHRPCHKVACSTVDTVRPSAPVLTATPGDSQVVLSWTGSTDNVGVTSYEVWDNGQWLASVPADTRESTVSGLTNGTTYTFRVVAYDAAKNYTNSNTVSATPERSTTPPPPPGGLQQLRASGRSIVDESGATVPTLKGFNVHVQPDFVWTQPHFDAMASLGAKINRAVLVWDEFEPSKGVISAAGVANLDAHIARAASVGIYTMLELHLNVGRTPAWTHDRSTEMEQYAAYGQTLTAYLANRYGNPASPKFTKAVVGFGLNEPPIEDSTIRNGNSAVPYLEEKQRQMVSWFRPAAPAWIGFISYAYASATPIHGATQNPNAIDANPDAFDSVGGNVVIDFHDYMIGCTTTDPNCDGRQWNGNIFPTWQGGQMLSTQGGTNYTSTALYRSQQQAYVRPYTTFSTQAQIPLMMGEWGWLNGKTGELAYIADKSAAWAAAGTAIEIYWNYDVSSSTAWGARPGYTWRPSVVSWMSK